MEARRRGRRQELGGPLVHSPPVSASPVEGEGNVAEELGVSDLPDPGSTGHCLLGSSLPQMEVQLQNELSCALLPASPHYSITLSSVRTNFQGLA